MTSTKSERTSDTVDFFPHHIKIPKNSSADSAEIVASPFKFEEPALAAIKKTIINFQLGYNDPKLNGHSKVLNFLGWNN